MGYGGSTTRRLALGAMLLAACSDGGAPDGPTDPGDDGPDDGDTTGQAVATEAVVEGLERPVHLTAPEGDPRLFVVEQRGTIRIVEDGTLRDEPFLDLTDRVSAGGERGLLSMAFHPDYPSNGLFYVDYTDTGGDTRIERYRVSPDPDRADPSTRTLVLEVEQPFANHNGGLVLFGPDGMLWVGMGDGGSAGDPLGHGQNPQTLLGALLRLDVDGGDPYAIPPDNPFADDPGGRGEIWATGLRNPWRFAFDATGGLLYVADVGQNRLEEVSVVPADEPGLDFGWSVMEGDACFADETCSREGFVLPALTYDHGGGRCSITGGFVYRGQDVPALRGHYLYSDFCAGFLRSFRWQDGAVVEERTWEVGEVGSVLSFGRDGRGEAYILSGDGTVRRIVAKE